jgi:uncharacterized protein YbjT (DUF2867 family)
MKVLVTGATGIVGRSLVGQLLERDAEVRAVTRDAARAKLPAQAEVVEGNPSVPLTLDGAFHDVDALFITTRSTGSSLRELLTRAAHGAVRRVLLISALTVEFGGGESRFSDEYRLAEDEVKACGLAWTILRCADFDSNVRIWNSQIRSSNVVRGAYGEAATACIHERDIAEVAATALCSDQGYDGTYALTGPERISQIDKVHAIGNALGRDLQWEEVPAERVREAMIAAGAPEEVPARMLGYLKSVTGDEAPVTDTVRKLLKRDARSFAEWAREHFAEFAS